MNFGQTTDGTVSDFSGETEGDADAQQSFELSHLEIDPAHNQTHAAEELSMVAAAPSLDSNLEPVIAPGNELLETLEAIPDKMAFKIGEAADMVGVKQYVLRYWETEFEVLKPRKSKNNQRVYSRRDVETAMMIKKLLYDDRFSIEGARTALRQLKTNVREERGLKAMAQSQDTAVQKLKGLVAEIRRIKAIFN
jgi:DNA-binding transcriptional MerR regulator